METFFSWVERDLFPALSRASSWKPLEAVRRGILFSLPSLVAGIPVFFFLLPDTGFAGRFLESFRSSLSVMALFVAFQVTYGLARVLEVPPLFPALSAIFSLALTFPTTGDLGRMPLLLAESSSCSIILALLIAVILPSGIKMLSLKKTRDQKRLLFVFAVLLLPSLFVTMRFLGVDFLAHLRLIVRPLLQVGDSLPAVLIVILMISLLWMAGVHGPAVISPLVTPFYLATLAENARAAAAGQPPPHVATTPFFNMVFLGGAGSTLSLTLLMLTSRIHRLRKLALISLLPGVANMNEPLLFGLPIVLNPAFFIPFFLSPLVTGTINYGVFYFHLLPRIFYYVPSVVPGFIAAPLATGGNLWAAFLVLGNLILSGIIYYPFLRAFEREQKEQEKESAPVKSR